MLEAQQASEAVRKEARDTLKAVDPKAKTKDSDYVFITFILTQLPHGVIGLLIAVMFASALSSKAGVACRPSPTVASPRASLLLACLCRRPASSPCCICGRRPGGGPPRAALPPTGRRAVGSHVRFPGRTAARGRGTRRAAMARIA